MLVWAVSIRQLRLGELMAVYATSNAEKAREFSHLPQGFALEEAEQEFRQYLREVFFKTPGAVCALWEVQGRYVSALRLEPYRDGLLLAGLETAPHHRKKGYAAALIQAVQSRVEGKLYSHVDKSNLASLKTHEKCGFRVIDHRAVYLDGSIDARCCTLLYEA